MPKDLLDQIFDPDPNTRPATNNPVPVVPDAAAATDRLTTAQVLSAYVHLGECLRRQQEHYDRLLTAPPQQVWSVLSDICEWAINAAGMVDRLKRGNK